MRLSDRFLIRMGFGIMAAGVALLFVPLHATFALIGFVVIGLGCAPIDPCLIHMTPAVFGENKSQAMIGVQTAFSYIGYLTMPTLFGLFAEYVSVSLLPVFLLALLLLMTVMHELVAKKDSL
jgi:MFS family permease